MFRRVIAGSFVALWLLLLGIDFSGDAGLIEDYRGSDVDKAVDSVLTSYGEAPTTSVQAAVLVPVTLDVHLLVLTPCLMHSSPTDFSDQEKVFLAEPIPIYKFHLAFLI